MENIKSVLIALRRIIRATDLHSRHLVKQSGLTMPQLVLMQTLEEHKQCSVSELAKLVNLSQATVTTIVMRLEKQDIIERHKDEKDKRRSNLKLSPKGRKILKSAPQLMQESFIQQFSQLADWEQHQIISSLQRIAYMMDAQELDASPILEVGPIAKD